MSLGAFIMFVGVGLGVPFVIGVTLIVVLRRRQRREQVFEERSPLAAILPTVEGSSTDELRQRILASPYLSLGGGKLRETAAVREVLGRAEAGEWLALHADLEDHLERLLAAEKEAGIVHDGPPPMPFDPHLPVLVAELAHRAGAAPARELLADQGPFIWELRDEPDDELRRLLVESPYFSLGGGKLRETAPARDLLALLEKGDWPAIDAAYLDLRRRFRDEERRLGIQPTPVIVHPRLREILDLLDTRHHFRKPAA